MVAHPLHEQVIGRRPMAEQAADLLAGLSLSERVGQLFCVAFGRHAPAGVQVVGETIVHEDHPDEVAAMIARYGLGGAIYFPVRPAGDPPHAVAAMVATLQAAAPVPLLIATDQEMGTVARLRAGFTSLPSAMAYAAIGTADRRAGLRAAADAARITARELRACGINVNFAPDADVNVNPANPVIGVRSFGAAPGVVAEYVAAQVRAYQAAGVAATAKHFPGHGDTTVDSHVGLPSVDHDRATWERVDLPPFVAAIAAGVDVVMTAHLTMPALDPSGAPGTLSRPILTGMLRERLGFTGVIATDALDMAGARARYGGAEAAVRALAAGADLLLMPPDIAAAHDAVLRAVGSGRIPAGRLDDAVRRILALKARLGILDADRRVGAAVATPKVRHAADVALADDIARRSITVLRAAVPIASGDAVLLTGVLGRAGEPIAERLTAAGCRVTTLDTGSAPDAATVARAAAAAAAADRVVAVTSSAWRHREQRDLLAALPAGRLIALAVREPYDAAYAPPGAGIVLSYGDGTGQLRAAGDVLAGYAAAGGRLPVDVPGPDGSVAFARGAGL